MAGNKINTRKKDDKGKSSRNADPLVEENEHIIDFSLLRKPIVTSITGFAQARKIFDLATEELKGLISNECDILYECKVCRNMFRSLANYISHKRVYCKEKFDSAVHGHFLKATSVMDEVLKIKKLEESYHLNENIDTNNSDEDDDSRVPITKDLTSVLEKITKNKGVQQSELENKQMTFQKIPKTSVAVFQNVKTDNTKTDTMKAQLDELHDILSQENAVLQSDGSFKVQSNGPVNLQNSEKDEEENADNVIQISDDDENEHTETLKCTMCDVQFSTLKTLKFHVKYKHLEDRLVFPCPDCLDIFSTSWSVYRHLFKVHRKTAAQIRRLREAIQAKAFRMNNPPTYYEKRKTTSKPTPTQKITEEERLHKENQAWLEELDGESEGRRCGGCGRTFERRAALAAHTHTCARRNRRRIQIQIRKDYNKEPNNPYLALAGSSAAVPTETRMSTEEVQTVDKVKEADDEKEEIHEEPPEAETPTPALDDKKQETEDMETDEIVIQNNKPIFYDNSMINKLPFAQQIEKNNLNAFRQKIQQDVDLLKLLCKKCDIKHDKKADFLDHMSGHYKWVRYACKLCNFKHFVFDKLPEHVKVVHKLKGNTEFYYSTVKAIDGTEALELSESIEEQQQTSETSPNSRRPSRCSSDSSRISDDSSSSSTRPETGSRKRKSNLYKMNAKKKKLTSVTDDTDQKDDVISLGEDKVPSNKIFEENSSDFDELEEKGCKRRNSHMSSVASRRPVRKKTKPKNADFEYDLSNLLKMEAQGYRDSQTVCIKPVQCKKKTQQELQNNYDIINKDCCGAMITLSRKSVECSKGHMKTASFPIFKTSKESRVFAKPQIPRMTRVDKNSPKKVETEDVNNSSPIKVAECSVVTSVSKELTVNKIPVSDPKSDTCDTTITQISTSMNNKPKDSILTKKVDTILNDCKDVVDRSNSSHAKDKNLTLENNKISTQTSIDIDEKCQNIIQTKKTDAIINDLNKDVIVKSFPSLVTLENDKTSTQTCKDIKKPKDVIKGKTIDSILNDLNKDIKVRCVSSSEKGKKITVDADKTSTLASISIIKPKDSIQVKKIDTISSSEKDKNICLEIDKSDTEKVVEDISSVSKPISSSSNNEQNLSMVPIKLRRQGLEVIKNPLIKQNITDFTKAGMKTKILVIKPIHRNTEKSKNLNSPLKFQTITLKDPSKSNLNNEEKKSDQVVVVKVPKVESGLSKSTPTSNMNNGVSMTTDSTAIETEINKKDISSNQEVNKSRNDSINDINTAKSLKILENNTKINSDLEDVAESLSSDEKTQLLNDDKRIIVESLEKDQEVMRKPEKNLGQQDNEQVLDNCDKGLSNGSNEMLMEEMDQIEPESKKEIDETTKESVNEVNEILVDRNEFNSQDS